MSKIKTQVTDILDTIDETKKLFSPTIKNKIIGGDFTTNPWQRGTSFNITNGASAYCADRFRVVNYVEDSAETLTVTKETLSTPIIDETAIFYNSLKIQNNLGSSAPIGNVYEGLYQPIEGSIIKDAGFGLAGERYVTLSFWCKSGKTGIFNISFRNDGTDRSYITDVAINQANTWEKKIVTIPVDTTGTWNYDNQRGLSVFWVLSPNPTRTTSTINTWISGDFHSSSNHTLDIADKGAGSVADCYFEITGIQLELGDKATPFEARTAEAEAMLCYRYYEKLPAWSDTRNTVNFSNTYPFNTQLNFKVTKRDIPSMSYNSLAKSMSSVSFKALSTRGCIFGAASGASGASSTSYIYVISGFTADAEL